MLITGATGSTGTSAIASLIQQGHAVRALVHRELVGLAGQAKLPIGELQLRRWHRLAALSPKQFDQRVQQIVAAAVKALDGASTAAAAGSPPKRQNLGPDPPAVKLSAWHKDEAGALTRELSAT